MLSAIVTKLSSVVLLATGEEVIKFWKFSVKGQGRWGRYALYWALLVLDDSLLEQVEDESQEGTVYLRFTWKAAVKTKVDSVVGMLL